MVTCLSFEVRLTNERTEILHHRPQITWQQNSWCHFAGSSLVDLKSEWWGSGQANWKNSAEKTRLLCHENCTHVNCDIMSWLISQRDKGPQKFPQVSKSVLECTYTCMYNVSPSLPPSPPPLPQLCLPVDCSSQAIMCIKKIEVGLNLVQCTGQNLLLSSSSTSLFHSLYYEYY